MYMLHAVDAKFETMKVKFKTEVYIKDSRAVLCEGNFLIGHAMRAKTT